MAKEKNKKYVIPKRANKQVYVQTITNVNGRPAIINGETYNELNDDL